MNWVFIGLLGGSLVTSTHDTREACEGRAVMMREQKVERGRCYEMPPYGLTITSGTNTLCYSNSCTLTMPAK